MNLVLLQATPAGGAGWTNIAMIAVIFVIFYFFMIRPQQKRQKQLKEQREALKAGDRIITSGGILGVIKHVNETNFQVEIADGVRIYIDKNSVFQAPEEK